MESLIRSPKKAEKEGFEPPEPLGSTVFKTAAIDHSAISPWFSCYRRERFPSLLMRRKDKTRHFLCKCVPSSDDDVPEDLPRQAGAKEDNAPRVGVDADCGRRVGAEKGLPSAAGERCGVDATDK